MRRLTDKEYRLFLSAISHIQRQDKYAIHFMLTGKYIDIANLLEKKVRKFQNGYNTIFLENTEKKALRDISIMEMYVCEKEDKIFGEDKANLVALCKSAFDVLCSL